MMTATPWKSLAGLLIVGGSVTAGVTTMALRSHEPAQAPAAPTTKTESPAKAEAKPILANASIEEGSGDSPGVWEQGNAVPGVEYLWSRDVGHEGKSSLGLKKTAQRYFPIAGWTQKVDRQGDQPRLKVSAWIKAEAATKGILDVQFLDGDGEWSHAWAAYIGPKEPSKPPTTHDWKRYEGVVTIPPGTRSILISPQIYGPGTLWFDDLAAEYTEDAATKP